MRRIARRSRKPNFMNSNEFRAAMDEFAAFHFRGGTRGKQGRSPLRSLLQPFEEQIRTYLDAQFDGVCAYTEVGADADQLTLGWHRPPANATELDGRVDGDHYWWLAMDHRNWYLIDEGVASVKGNSFPVLGGRMERPVQRGPKMPRHRSPDGERGLILDPCVDSPDLWLRFDDSGHVSARDDHHILGPRGAATIAALDLDSEYLRQRREEAFSMTLLGDRRYLGEPRGLFRALEEHAPVGAAHRGALIQILIRERIVHRDLAVSDIEEVLASHRDVFLSELVSSDQTLHDFDPGAQDLIVSAAEELFDEMPNVGFGAPWQQLLREATSVPLPPIASATPPAGVSTAEVSTSGDGGRRPIDPATTIWPTSRITRIEIRNFRAIEHLELSVDAATVDLLAVLDLDDEERDAIVTLPGQRWKMLLGENGSGKSSILHAIAMALSGAELDAALERAELTWDDLLRWPDDDGNRPDGRVLLEFTGRQRIDLRFDANSHRFWGLGKAAPAVNLNVRGYGAARFPATKRQGTTSDDLVARALDNDGATSCNIDNLLDSTVPILNAKAWLGTLDDAAFNVAAETISDLLGESSLIRATGSTAAATTGTRITRKDPDTDAPDAPRSVLVDGEPLSLVSDGYRSVIALGCEIMAGVGALTSQGGTSDLRDASGVVLIDEIGAHLHPRWRMQITGKLRKAFPNVQFFVTTHEPLCLRGLVEREVVRVTKYEEHGVLLDEIDRAPGRYRVDQLLTSEFFGLNSAIDPRVDRLFAEYYELKRKSRPSSAQLQRLEELEDRINDKALRPVLGYTRRDQLIFEAIDRFLIEDPLDAAQPEQRRARRNEIVEQVASIWNRFGGDGS